MAPFGELQPRTTLKEHTFLTYKSHWMARFRLIIINSQSTLSKLFMIWNSMYLIPSLRTWYKCIFITSWWNFMIHQRSQKGNDWFFSITILPLWPTLINPTLSKGTGGNNWHKIPLQWSSPNDKQHNNIVILLYNMLNTIDSWYCWRQICYVIITT